METILGIDEAGRGSILGPLVIVGVVVPQNQENMLESWGVQDSKNFGSNIVAKKTRCDIANKIENTCKTVWISIEPKKIDEYVTNKSLNILEQEIASEIIKKLPASKVILDGKNIFKVLETKNIYSYNQADKSYLSVGAASIVAKHYRDTLFEKYCNQFISEYPELKGGGYANQKTLEFVHWHLKKYQKLPDCYRKSFKWKLIEQK